MVLIKIVNLSGVQNLEQAIAPRNCLELKPGELYQANFQSNLTIMIASGSYKKESDLGSFIIKIIDNSCMALDDSLDIIRKSLESQIADKQSVVKQFEIKADDVQDLNTNVIRSHFSREEISMFEQLMEVLIYVKNLAKY